MKSTTTKRILILLVLLLAANASLYAQPATQKSLMEDFDTGVRFFGMISMFTSALLLAFTNRGRIHSHVYNRTRTLLIIATATIGLLMTLQFVGRMRYYNQCQSWAVTILALSVNLTCFGLAQMNLLRAGHKMKLPVMKVLYFLATGLAIMIAGYATDTFDNPEQPWKTTTALVALLLTAKLLRMIRILIRDMRTVRVQLNNEELELRKRALSYTSLSMNFVLIISIFAPWVGLTTHPLTHSLHGFIMFGLMVWYVVSVIRYGSSMDEVIHLEDEIREERELKEVRPESDAEEKQHIAVLIDQWVANKSFVDPSISLDQTAQALGIDSGDLSRYLSDKKGVKYRNWISHLRIEYAKELIQKNPNYSIQSIAELCGFKDRSSFQRTFAQHVGMPPRQWANQTEKD